MTRRDVLWALVLTAAIEALTCLFRFGLGLESTRDTSWMAGLTLGIRIHHGYIGMLVLLVAGCLPEKSAWRTWGIRIGMSLLSSDLIHHFGVLWITQGDPQFHLTYPAKP